MTPWLKEQLEAADDAAWEYLIARRKRNPDYNYITLHEASTLDDLIRAASALRGEAVSPTIGTAA